MSVLQSFGAGPINQRMEAFSATLTLRGKRVKFERRNDNVTAIKTLYRWLQDFDQIPKEKTQNEKNNEKSKHLRIKGNKMFENRRNRNNLTNVIDLYNQSICWAEHNNGEELAIGFANRSAVYFEWKKYEICLENINLAVEAGYPKRLRKKLNKRKADCIKLMQDTTARQPTTHYKDIFTMSILERRIFLAAYYYDFDRNRTVPKLSMDANPKVPFIVDCLEMQKNSKRGRYIVTKKDLKPGQIISIEEPFINSLTTEHRYRKCANCFAENCLNLIPCKSCTCTMFCSQKCRTEAEQGFHQFECPIADYIWSQCEEFALTLRLVVKAFTMFDTIQELIDFRKENKNVTVFSFDHTKGLSDKERYSQVDNLLTNTDKRVYSEMFMRCCKVAIFYHYLIQKTKFAEMLKTQEDRDTLISVIMQHTQVTSINGLNCHQCDDVDLDAFLEFKSSDVFARGIYPFSSLFNHSCAPNINTISVGTKIVTYVTRPITNNSELLGCYERINHFQQPKQSRIQMLLGMYHFVCKCEACENDFPELYDDDNSMALGNISDEGSSLADMMYNNLSKELADVEKFCSILQKYSSAYPCFSLYTLGLHLQRALTLKFGNLSTEVEISLRANHVKYREIPDDVCF